VRIAIDCSPLAKTRAGIGTYTFNLLRALTKIDRENEYFLLAHRDFDQGFELPANFVKPMPSVEFSQSTPWLILKLPRELRHLKIDIFHSTNFLIPPLTGCKTVDTIYDLSTLVMPGQHKFLHTLSHKLFFRSSLRRADRLIAISEFTKCEIIRLFPQYKDKISVALGAVVPEYRLIDDRSILGKVQKKYSLPERFILFVGTLEPRKNISGLLKAYSKVKSKIPHKLVVVGGKGWKYSSIFDLVKKLDLEQSIIFTDYVPAVELPVIYNLAEIFCYPSFYEGFGLPILEAMACGTPVITSDVTSLPEVAGDSALLADPALPEEIADRLLTLAQNENLRSKLAGMGLSRAAEFSWELTAKKTLEIYRQIFTEDGGFSTC